MPPEDIGSDMHPALPRVLCPECGGKMRLARIMPAFEPERRADTSMFRCKCGFGYSHTIDRR